MAFIYLNCLFFRSIESGGEIISFCCNPPNFQVKCKIASISLCIIHINIKFDTQNRGVLAGTVLKR